MVFRSVINRLALIAAAALLLACGGKSSVVDDPDGGSNNNNTSAECGNDVQEGGEDCDGADLAGSDCATLGLGTGSLSCTPNCTFDISGCSEQPECGNNTLEFGESCDGSDLGGATCVSEGYGSGDLSCDANCGLDVSQCDPCGNDTVDAGEQCDGADLDGETCASQGLGSGDLACSASCTFDTSGCSQQPVCGNDVAEGSEACDGPDLDGQDCASQGLGTGSLSCTPNCTFDTSACIYCGNGVQDGTEDCDGADLGGTACTDLGYGGGSLSCTANCTFDESQCTNCTTPDNTEPIATNHVPAPETQGAPQNTVISVDISDECGVDTSTVSMRVTITPKNGGAQVLMPTPTVTGTGSPVTASYTHPGGFDLGDLVEVMVTANDVNGNTMVETWRFSVVDEMSLFTGGSGGMALTNAIDEAQPDTNFSGFSSEELIGGPAGAERRYLLRFQPTVPAGALILSAEFAAGVCPPGATVATTLDCYQLNVDSSGPQSTWNSRMTGQPWSTPGASGVPADREGSAACAVPFDSTSPLYTWIYDDVTALVAHWASGGGYYGIVCENASTTPIPICSPYSNAPPKIDITFGPPLP